MLTIKFTLRYGFQFHRRKSLWYVIQSIMNYYRQDLSPLNLFNVSFRFVSYLLVPPPTPSPILALRASYHACGMRWRTIHFALAIRQDLRRIHACKRRCDVMSSWRHFIWQKNDFQCLKVKDM